MYTFFFIILGQSSSFSCIYMLRLELTVDLIISVKHSLSISPSEPGVTWFNTSFPEIDTVFDFDGMCDVIITCDPDLLNVSHVISGTEIIMTASQMASTTLNEYNCTLSPFHGERSFPDVYRTVFFGDEIVGFQVSNMFTYIS